MTTLDELRDLIRARRDLAENATGSGPWRVPGANVFRVVAPDAGHRNPPIGMTPPYPWRVVVANTNTDEDTAAADAAHIAANDPQTVIRNCDEDLAVLDVADTLRNSVGSADTMILAGWCAGWLHGSVARRYGEELT